MFRYNKRSLIRSFTAYAFIILCFATGFLIFKLESQNGLRVPASEVIENDQQKATLSVSIQEFQDSKPVTGRSFFDKIFIENGQYQVPYPFSKVLERLSDYTGQKINSPDGAGIKVTLIPMGRSLQRNAALDDEGKLISIDHFFRYPRVVVAIDEETNFENSLLLNLKNKMYLGFNEKARVIEAISYNDELGRFEFQVVNNYAAGKTSEVTYANRSLCLSCHQNQAPIFSKGPWSETNANQVIAEKLQSVFDKSFGKESCSKQKSSTYCYQENKPFYFGAPISIESNVTRQIDSSTDSANLGHAYQKMWKDFCVAESCRLAHLQSMLLYRLTGQEGIRITESVQSEVNQLEINWKARFPWGLAIPSSDIPNRDPLKDVQKNPKISDLSTVSESGRKRVLDLLAFSKIPSEFEPLLPRPPFIVWKDSEIDGAGANRLIRGLSQEFTLGDIKLIDRWLRSNRDVAELTTILNSSCVFEKEKAVLKINCQGDAEESFSLEASINLSESQNRFNIGEFNYRSKVMGCQPNGPNLCFRFFNIEGVFSKIGESNSKIVLQFKNGLGLKNSEAYDLSELYLDFNAKTAKLKVYDSVPKLAIYLQKKSKELFPNLVFNRFQIIKTILSENPVKLSKVQREDYKTVQMNVDADHAVEELEQSMSGFALMKNVCSQCHQSNKSFPVPFMGTLAQPLNDFELCRQIEQCAPRMIYRLKVRNCSGDESRKKKTSMPPMNFFKNEASIQRWNDIYNQKVLRFLTSLVDERAITSSFMQSDGNDIQAQEIVRQLLTDECPRAESAIYEQFPKCDLKKVKPYTTKTRCH